MIGICRAIRESLQRIRVNRAYKPQNNNTHGEPQLQDDEIQHYSGTYENGIPIMELVNIQTGPEGRRVVPSLDTREQYNPQGVIERGLEPGKIDIRR
jgi:hypothetical protein